MTKNTVQMKRSDAAKLLEHVLELTARARYNKNATKNDIIDSVVTLLERFNEVHGTTLKLGVMCDGEAHTNPLIDNCGACMPNWGFIGPTIKIK